MSMKGIKREIADLESKIERERVRIDAVETAFWKNGGLCCPGCGVEGWHDWSDAQDRRIKRLAQLRAKLARDSTHSSRTGDSIRNTILAYQGLVDRYCV